MSVRRVPRVLSPTKSVRHLRTTVQFKTSTICMTNRSFNVQTTYTGFDHRRLTRTMSVYRRTKGELCIAYGILPQGQSFSTLPTCFDCLSSLNVSTLVVDSLKAVTLTRRCTPRMPVRVSARFNIIGCTATGRLFHLKTDHIILTHRLSLRRVQRVHTGASPTLRLRTFMRNTVYVSFSKHYIVSGCLAKHSTGRKRYTRPYQ